MSYTPTISVADIDATGSKSSSTFLRGDGTWASASGNSVTATVAFGSSFTHFAQAVVTGQTWVAAGSEISVTPLAADGYAEDTALHQFCCVVSNIVAGVGFTLSVYTPIEAKGDYAFSCLGV